MAVDDGFARFAPVSPLTQGQMSAFLVSSLAALHDLEVIAPLPQEPAPLA